MFESNLISMKVCIDICTTLDVFQLRLLRSFFIAVIGRDWKKDVKEKRERKV